MEDPAAEYASSLHDLTTNSKPLISMLTMLAEEYRPHAAAIVRVIEGYLKKSPGKIKLPALYLIDSIIKNVDDPYRQMFTENIVRNFADVFQEGDEKVRTALFKLRQTWKGILPDRKLYALDVVTKAIDPNWPICPSLEHIVSNIHLNPKFFGRQQQQQQSAPIVNNISLSTMVSATPAVSGPALSNQGTTLVPKSVLESGRVQPVSAGFVDPAVAQHPQQPQLTVGQRLLQQTPSIEQSGNAKTPASPAAVSQQPHRLSPQQQHQSPDCKSDPRIRRRMHDESKLKQRQVINTASQLELSEDNHSLDENTPSATFAEEIAASSSNAAPSEDVSSGGSHRKASGSTASSKRSSPSSKRSRGSSNEDRFGSGNHHQAEHKDYKTSSNGGSSNKGGTTSSSSNRERNGASSSSRLSSEDSHHHHHHSHHRDRDKRSTSSRSSNSASSSSSSAKRHVSSRSDSSYSQAGNSTTASAASSLLIASASIGSMDFSSVASAEGAKSPSHAEKEAAAILTGDVDLRILEPQSKKRKEEEVSVASSALQLFSSTGDVDLRIRPAGGVSEPGQPLVNSSAITDRQSGKTKDLAGISSKESHASSQPVEVVLVPDDDDDDIADDDDDDAQKKEAGWAKLKGRPLRRLQQFANIQENGSDSVSHQNKNVEDRVSGGASSSAARTMVCSHYGRSLRTGEIRDPSHHSSVVTPASLIDITLQQNTVADLYSSGRVRAGIKVSDPAPDSGQVLLDGEMRDVRFVDGIAIAIMDERPPNFVRAKQIMFKAGASKKIIINDYHQLLAAFDGREHDFMLNGNRHRIRFGAPLRELYVDGIPYACQFNGQPIFIRSREDVFSIALHPPTPSVNDKMDAPRELLAKLGLLPLPQQDCPPVSAASAVSGLMSGGAPVPTAVPVCAIGSSLVDPHLMVSSGHPVVAGITSGSPAMAAAPMVGGAAGQPFGGPPVAHTAHFLGAPTGPGAPNISGGWVRYREDGCVAPAPPQQPQQLHPMPPLVPPSGPLSQHAPHHHSHPYGPPPTMHSLPSIRPMAPSGPYVAGPPPTGPPGLFGPPPSMSSAASSGMVHPAGPINPSSLGSYGPPPPGSLMVGAAGPYGAPPNNASMTACPPGPPAPHPGLAGPPHHMMRHGIAAPGVGIPLNFPHPSFSAIGGGPLLQPRSTVAAHLGPPPVVPQARLAAEHALPVPPGVPANTANSAIQPGAPSTTATATITVSSTCSSAAVTVSGSNNTATVNVSDLLSKLVTAGIIGDGGLADSSGITSDADVTGHGAGLQKKTSGSVLKPLQLVPDIPKLNFKQPDLLKRRYAGVIASLHNGLQCATCGQRFKQLEKNSDKYAQHLDWHFRMARREREGMKKATSRKWFYEISDWVQFEEVEDLEDRARSYFELQEAQHDNVNQDGQTLISHDFPSVPAKTIDHGDNTCVLCREPFDLFFCEDTEEWRLKNALLFDGQLFHPLCREDFLKPSAETDVKIKEETTPVTEQDSQVPDTSKASTLTSQDDESQPLPGLDIAPPVTDERRFKMEIDLKESAVVSTAKISESENSVHNQSVHDDVKDEPCDEDDALDLNDTVRCAEQSVIVERLEDFDADSKTTAQSSHDSATVEKINVDDSSLNENKVLGDNVNIKEEEHDERGMTSSTLPKSPESGNLKVFKGTGGFVLKVKAETMTDSKHSNERLDESGVAGQEDEPEADEWVPPPPDPRFKNLPTARVGTEESGLCAIM